METSGQAARMLSQGTVVLRFRSGLPGASPYLQLLKHRIKSNQLDGHSATNFTSSLEWTLAVHSLQVADSHRGNDVTTDDDDNFR